MIRMPILLLILFSIEVLLPQTQHKIPWPSLADSPWPTLRGDMQGTGRSEFVGPETLNVKWKADLPLGIVNGPIIGYGNKLLFGTHALSPGNNNYFYSYNTDSTQFWRFETPTRWPNINSALAVNDSTIYFLTNESYLYALNYLGTFKWMKYVGRGSTDLAIDKPGNLYLATGDTLKVFKPDGSILFVKYFDKIAGSICFSPDGGTIYFKSGDIYGLEPKYLNATDLFGNIKWQYPFFSTNEGQLAVDNQGNIYVYGMDDSVKRKPYLFSITDQGNVRWKYQVNINTDSSPCIDSYGNIIVCSLSSEKSLVSSILSISNNGVLNWEYVLSDFFDGAEHGLVCDAKGNIYFGSAMGTYFQALNNSGQLLWKLPLNGYKYYSSPAIGSDGTLYIGTSLSTFFAGQIDNLIAVGKGPSGVKDYKTSLDFNLYQNYPNPFNPKTRISFSIPQKEYVNLSLYNIMGQKISELLNEEKEAGEHSLTLNGNNLSTGIYIYKMTAGKFTQSKKLILLK